MTNHFKKILRNWEKTKKKILDKIGKQVLKDADNNFKKKSFYGDKWKARKSFRYEHPLLDDTGKMKNSFNFDVKGDSVIIRNTADYSGYHNEGTRNLPKRQILGENEVLSKEIENIIIKEMDKMFK